MILWETAFDAGNIAWVLLTALFSPALCWLGYWTFPGLLKSGDARQRLFAQFPLFLATLLLAWCGGIYSLAFAPSLGTLPLAEATIKAPMGNLREAMEFEDAKVDETHTFGRGGFLGGLDYVILNNVIPGAGSHEPSFPTRRPHHHLPHLVFCLFQFAVYLTVLFPLMLILGEAFSGIKLAMLLLLWSMIVYVPVAHAVAGDGWLQHLGTLDSSNGLILLALGCSALMLGSRTKGPEENQILQPHALAMTSLWVGMTLSQGGHVLQSNGTTALAIMNGLLGGAAGVLAWSFCTSFVWCRPHTHHLAPAILTTSAAMAACGGLVLPQSAAIIGTAAGVAGNFLDHWCRGEQRADRMLAAALCSGAMIGLLGAGIFATTGAGGLRWDGREVSGLLQGNLQQIQHQAVAIAVVLAWSLATTGLLRLIGAGLSPSRLAHGNN